jgi:Sec-independent protein translocase protein TatA
MDRATIGHNMPPDPIDEALVPFGDVISEAEAWLDGQKVDTEAKMKAADELLKGIKAARKAVDDARDASTKPLHEAWKNEVARWKPTQDDLDRLVKGLAALVNDFKVALAKDKEEARKKAEAEAWEKTRAAQEAARIADASNIEATRAAAAAIEEAEAAQRLAYAAGKDTVKGLRTVTKYEITDHKALLHWIAKNDKDAVYAFIEEWARKEYKACANADGLKVWTEKEAF